MRRRGWPPWRPPGGRTNPSPSPSPSPNRNPNPRCDEEADSVIYGDREAGTSDGVPPGISERNPVDFEGAAGLTSKHIYLAENPLKGLISNPAKDSRDPLKPTLHLRMARSCGLRVRLRIS